MAMNSNNLFDYLQIIDLVYRLSNDFLTKVDIASMENSLEVRPIMLDNDIASLALSLPLNYRVSFNKKQVDGKIILKDLLRRKLYNSHFIDRNKKGFTMPLNLWFKKHKTASSGVSTSGSPASLKDVFKITGTPV